MPCDTLKLSVIARTVRTEASFLEWHIPRVLQLCKSPLRELTVVVANNLLIRRLHLRFFDSPLLTDVMTFPLEQDDRGRAISGEIYLCLSVARWEAIRRRLPVRHELLLYAVHGILHLCGYDDLTARKYHAMHREEDRILRELGFGAVFSRPERGIRRKQRRMPSPSR